MKNSYKILWIALLGGALSSCSSTLNLAYEDDIYTDEKNIYVSPSKKDVKQLESQDDYYNPDYSDVYEDDYYRADPVRSSWGAGLSYFGSPYASQFGNYYGNYGWGYMSPYSNWGQPVGLISNGPMGGWNGYNPNYPNCIGCMGFGNPYNSYNAWGNPYGYNPYYGTYNPYAPTVFNNNNQNNSSYYDAYQGATSTHRGRGVSSTSAYTYGSNSATSFTGQVVQSGGNDYSNVVPSQIMVTSSLDDFTDKPAQVEYRPNYGNSISYMAEEKNRIESINDRIRYNNNLSSRGALPQTSNSAWSTATNSRQVGRNSGSASSYGRTSGRTSSSYRATNTSRDTYRARPSSTISRQSGMSRGSYTPSSGGTTGGSSRGVSSGSYRSTGRR